MCGLLDCEEGEALKKVLDMVDDEEEEDEEDDDEVVQVFVEEEVECEDLEATMAALRW